MTSSCRINSSIQGAMHHCPAALSVTFMSICIACCCLIVQDGLPGQLPMYKGTVDAVKTILRTEGWRGLYAGLTPSLIGSSEAHCDGVDWC